MDHDTPADATLFFTEHEAIHSAIHSCFGEIYVEGRARFRTAFQQASPAKKLWMLLRSAPFLGGGVAQYEEWAVKELQRCSKAINDTVEKIIYGKNQ